jgi:putative intracellular protease/amidase
MITADFCITSDWQFHDGNLITGQQQHSGAKVARLVIEALEGAAA